MSYVNCVCFDILDGNLMYSADGLGVIKVWNVYVTKQQSKKGEDVNLCNLSYLSISRIYVYVF